MRFPIRRSRYPRETIWGGLLKRGLRATNKEQKDEEDKEPIIVALRILSTGLESWTVVIDCGEKRRDVDSRLHAFAQKVQYRRFNVGLVYGPSRTKIFKRRKRYYTCHEIMRTVKTILPDVNFVGLFDGSCNILSAGESNDEG